MTADNTTRTDGPTGQGQCRCNGRYEGCDHDPRRCDNPGGGHRSPFFCAECDPRRIEHIGRNLRDIAEAIGSEVSR